MPGIRTARTVGQRERKLNFPLVSLVAIESVVPLELREQVARINIAAEPLESVVLVVVNFLPLNNRAAANRSKRHAVHFIVRTQSEATVPVRTEAKHAAVVVLTRAGTARGPNTHSTVHRRTERGRRTQPVVKRRAQRHSVEGATLNQGKSNAIATLHVVRRRNRRRARRLNWSIPALQARPRIVRKERGVVVPVIPNRCPTEHHHTTPATRNRKDVVHRSRDVRRIRRRLDLRVRKPVRRKGPCRSAPHCRKARRNRRRSPWNIRIVNRREDDRRIRRPVRIQLRPTRDEQRSRLVTDRAAFAIRVLNTPHNRARLDRQDRRRKHINHIPKNVHVVPRPPRVLHNVVRHLDKRRLRRHRGCHRSTSQYGFD